MHSQRIGAESADGTMPASHRGVGLDARRRPPSALVAAAGGALLLAAALQLVAIHAHSLTGDGSYHLVAGHQALRYGTNTVNLEHPPLAKLLMALPALGAAPLAPPLAVEQAIEQTQRIFDRPEAVHRLTTRARYIMLVLVVLPLALACYGIGSWCGGPRAGVLLMLTVFLSFPVVGNLTILQTDAAASLGFALTVLAAMRFAARPGIVAAAALGLAWGLAMSVKFSAALLAPTVVLALVIAALRWRMPGPDPGRRVEAGSSSHIWRRSAALVAVVFAAMTAVLFGTYALANRDYDRAQGRATIRAYAEGRGLITDDRMRTAAPWLLSVERYAPGPAQWLTGNLAVANQNAIGVYPSYAFGVLSSSGRWWYHPVVLLLKTPLALLVAAVVLGGGALIGRRWRPLTVMETPPRSEPPRVALPGSQDGRRAQAAALVGVTVAVYLGVAMNSNYNLGYRHLLPIVPLVYLPLAVVLARRTLGASVLVAVLAVECVMVAPLWYSASNLWWLGASNPTRFVLGNDSVESRQSLVLLDRVARQRGITTLGVLDPLTSERVLQGYVAYARSLTPGARVEPGWYVVSVTLEQFLPALLSDRHSPDATNARPLAHLLYRDALTEQAASWQPLVREVVRRGEDHGYVAGTYHLYEVSGTVEHDSPGY